MNGVEAILLQETWLRDWHSLNFSGRTVIRDDAGVGTAIVIDNRIQFDRVKIDGINHINYTAIAISPRKGAKRLLASVYVPCSLKKEEIDDDLVAILQAAISYKEFVIGGDLKARHSDWKEVGGAEVNTNGRSLKRWLDANRSC